MGLDLLLVNMPDANSRYPYLGLATIASVAREQGLSVAIMDMTAEGLTVEEAAKRTAELAPDVVGVSVMSLTLRDTYKFVSLIKTEFPGSVIVAGGAHINGDHEIIAPMGVKYAIRGDADFTLPEFCGRIIAGESVDSVEGIVINIDGAVTASPPAFVADMNRLPFPAYDLLPIDNYFSPSSSRRTTSMIAARGCPYTCVFCSKLEQRKFRQVSAERFADQIEKLVNEFDVGFIEFVDEIFTLKRKWVVELCEKIISRGLNFEWGAGTRADVIDDELMALMKKAGLKKLAFGVETGSEEVRFAINKNVTNEQYRQAVELCRRHGIISSGCMIFGHPDETEEQMLETVRFARSIDLDFSNFVKMMPIPNSELFETAKEEGTVPADIWTRFMKGESPAPIYTPATVDKETVDKIYRGAWYSFYFRPAVFWRNLGNLLSFKFVNRAFKFFYVRVTSKLYNQ